ncbi:unnamed protein product [Discosporangium mesarthrocarpum]
MTQRPESLAAKCAFISCCAVFGCFARIFTDKLFSLEVVLEGHHAPFVQSFVSNAVGSFILGALVRSELNEDVLPGLYTGLTTGFCGSYTTYSGWNLQLSPAEVGDSPTLETSDEAVAVFSLLITVVFFTCCLIAGGDVAAAMAEGLGTFPRQMARFARLSIGLGLSVVLVLTLALLLGLEGPENERRRVYWLSGLFAPFGALSRFFLARWFNDCWAGGVFPWGTFLANLSGSIMLGIIHYSSREGGGWEGTMINGFQTGFISCLTTMSSFVAEVFSHRSKNSKGASYLYLASTILMTQGVVAIIGLSLG